MSSPSTRTCPGRRSTASSPAATATRLSTLESILSAAGYVLTVTNRFGRPLAMDDDHADLLDAAGRRFPAHLPAYPVMGEMQDPWWGWRRIAWTRDDPRVPSHTYLQRRTPMYLDDYYADRRWDDAT